MSSSALPPSRRGPSSPIAEALDKNQQATAQVEAAADELAVVHAVLDTKLTHDARDPEVRKAVADTDKIEKRLTEAAEKLDAVNGILQQEVPRP